MGALEKPSYGHMNREAESAVIGKLLTDPRALDDAVGLCCADDFTSEFNARVFAAAVLLRDEGMAISLHTIRAKLFSGSGIADADPVDDLSEIALASPRFGDVRDFARIVSDMGMRRRLDAQLEAGRDRLLSYDRPIIDALADVMSATGEAVERHARARGHVPLPEAVLRMMRKLEDATNGVSPPAIRTGLNRLDNLTGGFQAGDVVIVAGRPSMGKSLLLSAICRAAVQAQDPALLFELEMPGNQLLERLACDLDYDRKTIHQKPLAYTRLRAGKISDDEFARVAASAQTLASLPLQIFDTAGLTIQQIAAQAERHVSRSKRMGIIAIDYLQIVRPSNRYSGSKVNEITEISNAAKVLAKNTGWPVVLGCQLSRAIEARQEKRPTLSDLRESGAIEQDADIVIGLHRPAWYVQQRRPANGRFDPSWNNWSAEWRGVCNDLEIAVLKNRNGPPGVFNAHIEIAAGAIRNRKEDEGRDEIPDDYFPQGYAG